MARKNTSVKRPIARSKKNGSRKLRRPEYKSFRLTKRIKHPGPDISSGYQIMKRSLKHVLKHKNIFLGLIGVHILLTVFLVRGFSLNGDLSTIKDAFSEASSGVVGQLQSSVTVVGYLVDSVAPSSDIGIMYQSILLVLFSLFVIWALRQTLAGEHITLKDSFYKSTYPLIPFLGVLLIITIQFLPLLFASYLYAATLASGVSSSFAEILAWSFLAFLLALWSLYMISSSMFALYIVTLPDMTPIKAIKAAKKLADLRRWTLIRKFLFLPFTIIVTSSLALLLVAVVLVPFVEIFFFLLSSIVIVVAHSYLYTLYRELLDE